jgi:hypothetical protein
MFGYFALGAGLSRQNFTGAPVPTPLLALGAVLVALMIGLRFEVGADWPNYQGLFAYAGRVPMTKVLELGDPGYQVLNWEVRQAGFAFWVVNLACGAIFTWGLYRFCWTQYDPWLSFLIAVPYLVIVVAMGYARQGVAIGILLAGLAAIERGASVLRFAIYVAVAALFHKTAVVVLPLVICAGERNRLLNSIAGIACFILLYDMFLADSVEGFVKNYVDARYNSQGAAIRVGLSLVPAVIYLANPGRFRFPAFSDRLWRNFSLAAIAILVALVMSPSSTAVDRIALYLLPLQLAIFGRLPYTSSSTGILRAVIIALNVMILFVWLSFAAHAQYWLPYQFYPVWD